jgi:hypothetical protein
MTWGMRATRQSTGGNSKVAVKGRKVESVEGNGVGDTPVPLLGSG